MNDQDIRSELEMRRGGIMCYSAVLTLLDHSLQHKWTSWRDTGNRTFALSELSSHLGSREASPRQSISAWRQGGLFLVIAALLISSPLRGDLILLIGFLCLIGVIGCARGLPSIWTHRRWTVIQKKDGSPAFHIPHDLCSVPERELFEQSFLTTMKDREIPTPS